VWAGGVTVEHTVAGEINAPTGPNGRLVVGPDLAVAGRDDVYAVGDAAAVLWGGTGPQADTVCPQVAQVAIQSGGHAARQILAKLAGRPTIPFAYKDKGIMATIGRRAAITQFRSGRVVRGTFGWLAWLALHLVYLVGFRNKIVVFINWSWRYLSWGSGPRIIVSEESVPSVDDGDGPVGG
jgi:NADH dehydrogenase